MPMYPLLFAAWGLVLAGSRPVRLIQAVVVLLIVVMSAMNVLALSEATAERDRDRLRRRVEPVLRLLGPEDRIYVVLIQDPLFLAKRDPTFSFTRDLKVGVLVPVGYASTPNWRGHFAQNVQRAWAKGGRTWITKRVLSRQPKAEWDWVEGDEKSVRWSDLPSFFEAFELDQDLGDEDGFVVLARTPHNEQLLRQQPVSPPNTID